MRLFFALLRNGRWPQDINNVPFKAVLPMKLRNHVSGKSDRQKLAPCIQELTVFFARLKEHEFNDELCAKETAALRAANREFLTTRYKHLVELYKNCFISPFKTSYDDLDHDIVDYISMEGMMENSYDGDCIKQMHCSSFLP